MYTISLILMLSSFIVSVEESSFGGLGKSPEYGKFLAVPGQGKEKCRFFTFFFYFTLFFFKLLLYYLCLPLFYTVYFFHLNKKNIKSLLILASGKILLGFLPS